MLSSYWVWCGAELAMARLLLNNSGGPDADLCHWISPGYHLAGHHPPGYLHHSGSCGLSHVYSLRLSHPLYHAPDAQQAPCKRCHQKDEPAGLGKANWWAVGKATWSGLDQPKTRGA